MNELWIVPVFLFLFFLAVTSFMVYARAKWELESTHWGISDSEVRRKMFQESAVGITFAIGVVCLSLGVVFVGVFLGLLFRRET